MTAPDSLRALVEKFDQHRHEYRQHKNETELRREFLDPFFEALGWDMFNRKNASERYKEVVHEASVEVDGQAKAADYAFRIGEKNIFFVEAKKPSVNIETNPEPAFQLRSYGWSGKLALSLLTDFEQLAVYDVRARPYISDKASVGRVKLYHYSEYIEKWDEIAGLFSREAVLQGAFDQFAEGQKGRKGTAEVDDAFLAEIERWRDLLARNIALRNPPPAIRNERDLNFAVQMTIDRIIFLRICEDRGIEPDEQLKDICAPACPLPASPKSDWGSSDLGEVAGGRRGLGSIYSQLLALFRRADTKYNSGLFHFASDSLTPGLVIDDKPLKDILQSLYYPVSPYKFNYISADILGQVYEQFLGKVIRLTAGHQAKVEEKPEVRKAGGVYYTPTYIVDYIVKNTVGQLVEGKTPKDTVKLRILDPACGSGSFLLGAYQYLLDWHLNWYATHEPERWASGKDPVIYQGGGWKLTTAEKKRILLDNIFGVDIDPQAVEVTKLSLLLKVLEGSSGQLSLGLERILPDLGRNIQCGNSLISPDYYEGRQMGLGLFDEEEQYRVNAFNWQSAFPHVFAMGGFDAVIGNPPYIQLSMADYYNDAVNTYFVHHYSSSMGRLNTFGLFIDKILKILKQEGVLSFIVPNTILTQEYYQALRLKMLQHKIISITNYLYPVFEDAVVETIVFVVQNRKPDGNEVEIVDFDNKTMISQSHKMSQQIYLSTHKNAFLVTSDSETIGLKHTIDGMGSSLGIIANINQAIALKYDRSKSLFTERKAENYKPVLDGRNIGRYELSWGGMYLAYDVENIHSCKRTDIFDASEKLFFRRVGDRLIATYDDNQFYALNTLVVITLLQNPVFSLKYLLGLINSNLLNFYYVKFLKSTKKVFSEIQARQLAQLPIRTIDFTKPAEKAAHERMVGLVEQMLALHRRLPLARTPQEKEVLERQAAATDESIDTLVYQLYGLSEEEIRIVEGS